MSNTAAPSTETIAALACDVLPSLGHELEYRVEVATTLTTHARETLDRIDGARLALAMLDQAELSGQVPTTKTLLKALRVVANASLASKFLGSPGHRGGVELIRLALGRRLDEIVAAAS
jgi:hypothetical protein